MDGHTVFTIASCDAREEPYQSGDRSTYIVSNHRNAGVVDNFAFHEPSFPASYLGWLGGIARHHFASTYMAGAIVGSLETLVDHSVSRDEYSKNNKLPDWTRLDQGSATIYVGLLANQLDQTRRPRNQPQRRPPGHSSHTHVLIGLKNGVLVSSMVTQHHH